MPEAAIRPVSQRGVQRMRPLLGTYVGIGATATGAAAEAAVARAFGAIEFAQRLWSFHDPDSELSRINRAACSGGDATVRIHPLTFRLLRLARGMGQASGERFNCTVGGLLVRAGALPDHGGACLARGCADDIVLGRDADGAWCRLRRPVRLTLDGIAKGYAVDLAVRSLRRDGMRGGWINAGGDLRSFGDALLPIQRRELDGRMTPLGHLNNAALASSRVSRERDAAFPALIVGADDGPGHDGVHSVLSRYAWRADALTKVASLLPAADRVQQLHRLGGYALPGVDHDARASCTSAPDHRGD